MARSLRFWLSLGLSTLVALAVLIVLGNFVKEKLKARFATPRTRWRPVGIDSLAADSALDPALLARWQAARVLYVEHGPRGRVVNASTTPPGVSGD